jgi:hypothetical protein
MRHPQEAEGDDPVHGSGDTLTSRAEFPLSCWQGRKRHVDKVCRRSDDGISH